MNRLVIPPALHAAALTVFLITATQAAPVPSPNPGDIFLGLRSDTGTRSYLINLGPDTTFRNAAAGSSFTVAGLGNIAADLVAQFGEDWHSQPGLSWGLFGERSTGFVTTYGSKARTNPATPTTPYIAQDQTARASTSTFINGVISQIGGYHGSEATANSPVATFQDNSSANSSYARQVGEGSTDFGSLSGWASIEGASASGIASTVLDLYRFSGTATSNTVTNLGSFTLSSTGVIRFTAPAAAGPVDTDKDGFTDAQEIYAGTNPNDPASFFRVTTVSDTPTGVRVQTTTAANRTYIVQYTADLTTAWADIFTHNAGAGATALEFIDTDAARRALGKGFYRIRIQ